MYVCARVWYFFPVCVCVFFFLVLFRVHLYVHMQHWRKIIVRLRIFVLLSSSSSSSSFFFTFFLFRKFHSQSLSFFLVSSFFFCFFLFSFFSFFFGIIMFRYIFGFAFRETPIGIRRARSEEEYWKCHLDREVRNDGGGKIERDTLANDE